MTSTTDNGHCGEGLQERKDREAEERRQSNPQPKPSRPREPDWACIWEEDGDMGFMS